MIDLVISTEALEPSKAEAFCADESAGGTVVFIGSVRNQTSGKPVRWLEFEAYEPMALKEMRKIADHMFKEFGALRIAIHHREGRALPGELAVVIAVSTPHRAAAFDACEYAIDTLKETVPIWKKEVFEDGGVWVSAHP